MNYMPFATILIEYNAEDGTRRSFLTGKTHYSFDAAMAYAEEILRESIANIDVPPGDRFACLTFANKLDHQVPDIVPAIFEGHLDE